MAERAWQLAFQGHLGSGAELVTTFAYVDRHDDTDSDLDATTVAGAVATHLAVPYLACLPTDAHIDVMTVREIVRWWPPYDEIPEASSVVVNANGAIAPGSDRTPDGLAAKLSVKGNAAVRGAHGWRLIPGSPNAGALSGAGKWEGAYVTSLQNLATKMMDDLPVGLFTNKLYGIVYSYSRHRRGDANWFFDMASVTASTTPTWLRKRMTIP